MLSRRKRQRLAFVGFGLIAVGIAAAIILSQLEEHLVFFHTPSELKAEKLAKDRRLRIGGLVEEGSVVKPGDGSVAFRITDLAASIPVRYRGIVPDLFREGQGVVAEGKLQDGVLIADQVLAKHDENYMPPEVADALKQSGQWQNMRAKLQGSGQLPPAGGSAGGGSR